MPRGAVAHLMFRIFITLLMSPQYDCFVEALIQLDMGNTASIKTVSRQLADSVMGFYTGDRPGQTPGLVPMAGDFNWWEGGAMFGQMIEYWYYTGDDKYNDATKQALLFQVGPENNFEPQNQTRTEGNDDQVFWAFAAMSAAEMKFPNPGSKQPSWLSLAQAVFNRQADRWDNKHCNGGLRWQFNSFNNGWMMKNSISNGGFFQLAARLARYTKNDTYAQWADKTYNWLIQVKLISENFEVYDNIGFSEQGCDKPQSTLQWSYNIGTMIAGSAFMYNHTNGHQVWKDRLQGYITHVEQVFFSEDSNYKIMIEYACEMQHNCNKDQRSFKAYLSRWLAIAAQIAPFTTGQIMPLIQASSYGAMSACIQAADGVHCGRKWNISADDGERDIGNQMAAMSIVQSNLILKSPALADITTGISLDNPNKPTIYYDATRVFTTGEKAGAWTFTALVLAGMFFGALLLPFEHGES